MHTHQWIYFFAQHRSAANREPKPNTMKVVAVLLFTFSLLFAQMPPMPPTPQAQTVTPRRFVDALPMPSVHSPLSKSSSGTYYEVRIVEAFHKFHSDLPPTRIFAYEGVYPGPTFVFCS